MRSLCLTFGMTAAALIAGGCGASSQSGQGKAEATVGILDAEKQKLIWDGEHFTFEIETLVARQFAQLFAKREAEALSQFFTDDFQGSVPRDLKIERRRQSIVTEVSTTANDEADTRSVDAKELVAHLLDATKEFQVVDRNRLRILKIIPLDEDRERWRVELLFTQHGKGDDGRLLAFKSHHHAELHFSDDEDIEAGQIIAGWDVESRVLSSAPSALLEEITEQTGLASLPLKDNWNLPAAESDAYRYQIAVEDFDRDGFADIAIASHSGMWLLRSDGGRKYVDVTESVIPHAAVFRAERLPWAMPVWIDYDNDGYPDLLMRERLYHNEQGRKFVDVTEKSGLNLALLPAGCAVADFDADGLLDLYVVYQEGMEKQSPDGQPESTPWVGDTQSGMGNQLWRNEGDGQFRNVTFEAGVGGGARHTFAAVWFHFDEDHFPDLYLANDFGKNTLLRNRGDGSFEDVSEKAGAQDFATSMGAAAGDLDNDGTSELYVANMYSKMGRRIIAHVNQADYPEGIYPQIQGSCAGNRLYEWSSEKSRYREVSESLGINGVGWAYAPAMVDLDGDGWLDLYATTGYMSYDRKKPDG